LISSTSFSISARIDFIRQQAAIPRGPGTM
jgi:hypothetical protein